MAEFFSSVLNFFETIGDFIKTMFESVLNFGHMVSYITSPQLALLFTNYLPAFLTPFLLLGISVLVLKVLLDLI